MKRPLGHVIICYVSGIALADVVPVGTAWWLALGLLLAGVSAGSPRVGGLVLPLLLLVSGAANLAHRQQPISPHDLRRLTPPEPLLATVRATVERVDLRSAPAHDDAVEWMRTLAQMRVSAVRISPGDWQPAHGVVLANTKFSGDVPVRSGQVVEVFGVLKAPPTAYARGLFDYRAHLARREIYRQLEFDSAVDLHLVVDHPPGWADRFQRQAMEILARGFGADDPGVGLLWALCVGWLLPLTDEVSEPFMRSGTMHLFAISGQHIALIAGIFVALLRLVRMPRRLVGVVVIPLLWFYTAATGWQPSAVRSTIMMTVVIAGWMLRRPVDLLNSLSAAAFLILLWDPHQLFQAGFQLSFVVVASIATLLPPIEAWRQRLLATDPLLPPELRPRWQHWLDTPLRWITVALAVSIAAWLGSLPLIMKYFNLFTPVGLIANIVVVQLGSLALAAALGALACWPVVPYLSGLFQHAAWFFAQAMAASSEWFSELPAAWSYVQAPTLPAIAAYYAALWLIISGRLRKSWRWSAPAVILLFAFMAIAWHREHRHVRLTVLPLRGGHALFLEQPGVGNWLIDCGDVHNWRFRTRALLQARGVDRIDNFVLSHGDVRHIGAASNVLAEFAPRRVWLNPVPQRSRVQREFERALADAGITPVRATAGESFGPWDLLHPTDDDDASRADTTALVMSLRLGGRRLLHLPDLDAAGLERMRERHPDLGADIVVASPAADLAAWSRALLAFSKADMAVIVDTDSPAAERLKPEHRSRLKALARESWFTRESGVVEFRFEAAGAVRLQTANP